MADFTTQTVRRGARGILSPLSPDTPIGQHIGFNSAYGFGGTNAAWTANRAVYMPVLVENPITVTDMGFLVNTQSGNVDAGIYSWNGAKIVTTGSIAMGAAGFQNLALVDTLLTPGWYFIAFAASSATANVATSIATVPVGRICGFQEQALGALPLPATATFATYATALAPWIVASYYATW
jgi:hypothetical protein